MKSAKTDQINAATELMKSKTIELGDTKADNANAKQDLLDTQKMLAADTKFLETLKAKCENADQDYAARQKVRSEEIQAVSETIGILTSDESQQAFSKSQSFIQMSLRTRRMSAKDQRREKAAHLLKMAAMKSGDAQLAKLAVSVKADVFAEVKKAIDGMMAELSKIQAEEAETYEYCTSELKANEKETEAKTELKA